MTEHKNEAAGGASRSDAGLGAAVLVDGKVVAWFAEFDEAAEEWCTENHFGRWLVWRATAPEIVPLTQAEYEAAQRKAAEFATLFEALPEAPNAQGEPVGYNRIFAAITAATTMESAGISISVRDFINAIGGEIYTHALPEQGEVAITWDESMTRILAVTRQDEEGRIISVVAEAPAPGEQG